MKVLVVVTLLCASACFAKSIKDESSSFPVFCYYGSWSNWRAGVGRFGVSDLPIVLCTHIVYTFLGLDANGDLSLPAEEIVEGKSNYVADLVELKQLNPSLKILASIGGWHEGSLNFSAVVNNDILRANFVSNVYNYIDTNGLDGLDLNWLYPAQRGGIVSDKEQFVVLVKDLKEIFADDGYLLTASVAITQANIDLSYNVPELSENLDYINLMLYEFHGSWDAVTGVNAPLYPQLTDDDSVNVNANNSVNIWISNGAAPEKLTFGLSAFGRTFNLTSLDNTSTGAPVTGAGEAGPYVAEAGNYAYYEICEDQQNNPTEWSITEVTGNYVYANKDLLWVGYDNPDTIYAKAQYAREMGLGGIMFWAVDLDDFGGLCGIEYPLLFSAVAGFASV